MFGIGLPELIVVMVVFVIPLGIIILIISILNSRSKRRLKQQREVIMSYCTKCGKEVAAGSSFCPKCGDKLSNIQSDMQSAPVSSAITEQDWSNFIGSNADKYLAKFKKFSSGGTDSFSANGIGRLFLCLFSGCYIGSFTFGHCSFLSFRLFPMSI